MKLLLALTIFSVGAAWAQEKPVLNARELFYTPPQAASSAPKPAEQPKPSVSTAKNSKKKVVPKRKAAPAPVAEPQAAEPQVAEKSPAPRVQPAEHTQIETVAYTPAVPLGLRYSVLKRDSEGKFVEVDPDSTFHSGDRIRLQVEANTGAYLYVVMQGSSGNWRLLFPSKEVSGGSNRVSRGESRQIPSGNRGQFVFDEQAGTEKLFLVLSREPEADLDKLIYSIKTPNPLPKQSPKQDEPAAQEGEGRILMASASVNDDVIQRLRGQMLARDLVFEKSDSGEDGKPEKAAYVVNRSTAPDARLVVDLALKHN